MSVVNRNFGARKTNTPFSLILILCLVICLVGTTFAFLFATDWSSKYVTMSGKVDIEAVGGDGSSIEDVVNDGVVTSKLSLTLQDNYKYLIPNMTISMPVNVKVYKSTTTPLLRAKFSLKLYSKDASGNETILEGENDVYEISPQMTDDIHNVVTANGWRLNPDDGYYYYIEDNEVKTPVTDTLLSEVDATDGDVIIFFVKTTDLIRFPKNVESTQSGLKIKFIVTFQAIQNYIPNSADGGKTKLPVTITNSKVIFDDDREPYGDL